MLVFRTWEGELVSRTMGGHRAKTSGHHLRDIDRVSLCGCTHAMGKGKWGILKTSPMADMSVQDMENESQLTILPTTEKSVVKWGVFPSIVAALSISKCGLSGKHISHHTTGMNVAGTLTFTVHVVQLYKKKGHKSIN